MTLTYAINSKRPLTLNLYEAEQYTNAVIVQPLVSNLVRYSNKGRYEPFLAESWRSEANKTWVFTLRKDFVCEDGEVINASKLKRSIELSILKLSKSSALPILESLVGRKQFLDAAGEGEISGITADNSELRFTFERPVNSGLIQLLSFAPFGYICTKNRDQRTGEWIDDNRFISSGPYMISSFEADKHYSLDLREEWKQGRAAAPSNVKIVIFNDDTKPAISAPYIEDSSLGSAKLLDDGRSLQLVPEYLFHLNLSNRGVFKSLAVRSTFESVFSLIRNANTSLFPFGSTLATSFYPAQENRDILRDVESSSASPSKHNLTIMGTKPTIGSPQFAGWLILEKTLNELGWTYSFYGAAKDIRESTDTANYDVRIGATSIGGGAEAWGVKTFFCSDVGPRLSDPSGGICGAVLDFEKSKIDGHQFSSTFAEVVNRDKAVLPIYHLGIVLRVSDGIDISTMSPLIAVIRFDELRME